MFVRVFPAVLSLLTLGAHFLRRGQWTPCGACVLLVLALLWRRAWVPRMVQAALAAGSLLWIANTILMVRQRAAEGGPTLRLALILGSVTLFTAASAWLVGTRRVRERYATTQPPVEPA